MATSDGFAVYHLYTTCALAMSKHAFHLGILSRTLLIVAGYALMAAVVYRAPGRHRPVREVPAPAVVEGLKVWQRENCASCHAVFGLGGHLGPDLVNSFPDRGPRHLRLTLDHGAIGMPAFKLPAHELQSLNAYLEHLSEFGRYPVMQHPLPPFGDLP